MPCDFGNDPIGLNTVHGTCVSLDGQKTAKFLLNTDTRVVALNLTTKFSLSEVSLEAYASKMTDTRIDLGNQQVKKEVYQFSTAYGDGSQNRSIRFNITFDQGKLTGIYSFLLDESSVTRIFYIDCNQD